MAPTVRIDGEVWAWLKGQARPLEDTPNTILRRVAGLDPPIDTERTAPVERRIVPDHVSNPKTDGSTMDTPLHRFTGEGLRRQHNLPVRHCLYHRDGTFYERLSRFPGALCDPQGWVQFDTEEEFERDQRIKIGEKVNVPHGIFSHPKYQRFPTTG